MSTLAVHKLKIKERFKDALPALSKEEYATLEQNLLAEGWRSHVSIVCWKEGECILDGHNRYEICQKHELPFRYVEVSFEDADVAHAWLLDEQLGRRSFMNEKQRAYFIGVRYNLEKKKHGGDHGQKKAAKEKNPSPQIEDLDSEKETKTADKLAEKHNVSRATVERYGEFAAAVNKIEKAAGKKVREDILSGELNLPKADVIKIAEEVKPEEQKQLLSKPIAEIKEKLHPEVATAKDKKSPYFASNLWKKITKDLMGFMGMALETYGGYAGMLASPKWDASCTLAEYQWLETHIEDMQGFYKDMKESLTKAKKEKVG